MFNHHVKTTTGDTLARVQNEYAQLLKTTSFSLQDLFNYGDFRLDTYCKKFNPHPQSAELTQQARQFGEHYGIWMENAKHYISCVLYVFPTATFERMAAMVKNNAIDYYLNDTMGREIFRNLTSRQQLNAKHLIYRMACIDETLETVDNAHPLELANAEILKDIQQTAPPEWFSQFLKLYSYHIAVTHKDCNVEGLGFIPTVDKYIEMRNHTSGMPHIVMLVEYSTGVFLDWPWLAKIKVVQRMKRLHKAAALIGCLMNDLFSFEKEVIDNDSDSNLLMSFALNNPDMSLRDIIYNSAAIVRDLLMEFMGVAAQIEKKCEQLSASDPVRVSKLRIHLSDLDRSVQASWMWQVYTKRFKRMDSIWEETQLQTAERVS